jgi:short-subunit dehydrogenase
VAVDDLTCRHGDRPARLEVTRLAIPLLRRSDDPRIVTTVSLSGIFPLDETSIYTASKFGLRGAMLAIGLDLRAKGIHAGSVLSATATCPPARGTRTAGGTRRAFRR